MFGRLDGADDGRDARSQKYQPIETIAYTCR